MLDSVSYDWGSLHMFDSLVLGVRVNDSCQAENH